MADRERVRQPLQHGGREGLSGGQAVVVMQQRLRELSSSSELAVRGLEAREQAARAEAAAEAEQLMAELR